MEPRQHHLGFPILLDLRERLIDLILAAFGVIWTTILVSVAILYYLIARRYGIQN